MNETVMKFRTMLQRALSEAEAAGDLKAVMDIGKALIPLEQSIAEEEREAASHDPHSDVDEMDAEQCEAEALRLAAMARELRREPRKATTPFDSSPVVLPAPPSAEPLVTSTHTTEPATTEPVPAPLCKYCHQPLKRCAEIKESRLDAWQALHWNDPSEVKRRDDYATAVMMKQVGKRSPWEDY